ncbi:MAG: hypothetical protein HDR20_12450 [Lachnospiraceae bacterium]|nr:hypothetical protein [Lachnospiraceae bacterium]
MNKRQLEVQKALADNEAEVIKQLKQIYARASKDCENKIRDLSARTDMENLKSIVWQKQYQEALKKQIDGVLDKLNAESFTTIADYLTDCYENGFLGTLYDLQGQGIPLSLPINQEEVVQAIQIDSKISKGLYQRMGEDTNQLKKSIRSEVSRGVSNGSSWNTIASKIAFGMNSPFMKAYNRAIGITRTEGHRVQQESTLHCQQRAKEKGADIAKQWDSTLDSVTRPTHRELDGQIREIDEPFEVEGKKAMYPGAFGDPSEDCNCRCCLLQRAKWALSDEEYYTKFNGDKNELVRIEAKTYNEFKEMVAEVTASQKSQFLFKETATIKEAEAYARDVVGVPNVSFKGVDIKVANSMNEALTNAVNYCPDLLKRMNFYGAAQERNKKIKKELEAYYTNYFASKGYTDAAKYGKRYASRFVGRISSNTYALAYSGEVYGSGVTDELRAIVQKWSGIGVNVGIGNDYEDMLKSVQWDMSIGYHPQGCDSVRSIFDHEFGHQLDFAFGLRSNEEIKNLWSGFGGKTERSLAVSSYGAENIKEFIAEAYAEYVNSEKPRQTALTIGSIIEGKVNQ